MKNLVWYHSVWYPNELWGICQDWWGEEENIGDLGKKIEEDIVRTEHLKTLIGVLNCAVCPTEICVGFKVKTANMVGYMFFYKHMKSLGDLIQAWSSWNSEYNGVRKFTRGILQWGNIECLPMIIITDYENLYIITRESDECWKRQLGQWIKDLYEIKDIAERVLKWKSSGKPLTHSVVRAPPPKVLIQLVWHGSSASVF